MKRSILLSISICLLALLLVACNDQGSSTSQVAPATPTATPSTPTPAPTFAPNAVQSMPIAVGYYQALKMKDYDTAYTYLSADAKTQDGQPLTKEVMINMARTAIDSYGPISTITMLPESSDGTQIVTTIDRNTDIHYHSHLTLKKEQGHWKIIMIDRI
ncbi:hypothetical protein [Ktedonospora formicarum]|uniref:DUF4878 domain-containing protein n=1 Tax=Ktedonospora formicarum TaxID=2778364 RepID=A0A8J3HWU4_9CHLR|nr:hypothetical protein [Ktedonospora formicarum]GHO42323.1 hypothetical protein KSX_04860 [Ktedonospora formicarum]